MTGSHLNFLKEKKFNGFPMTVLDATITEMFTASVLREIISNVSYNNTLFEIVKISKNTFMLIAE